MINPSSLPGVVSPTARTLVDTGKFRPSRLLMHMFVVAMMSLCSCSLFVLFISIGAKAMGPEDLGVQFSLCPCESGSHANTCIICTRSMFIHMNSDVLPAPPVDVLSPPLSVGTTPSATFNGSSHLLEYPLNFVSLLVYSPSIQTPPFILCRYFSCST